MSPNERRMEIFDALCLRRQDTVTNLAEEFGVSKRTIRRDIEELKCSFPIETVRGRYGGGVKVAEWYHQNRKMLSPEQVTLLEKLAPGLEGHDFEVMQSIISQFAPRRHTSSSLK